MNPFAAGACGADVTFYALPWKAVLIISYGVPDSGPGAAEPSVMTPTKNPTLNLRIDPALKQAARIAAIRAHRSMANLVEVLIRRHCEEVGIAIPEQAELFGHDNGDESGWS